MSPNVLRMPQRQAGEDDEILTIDEAAQFLKVKKSMLYNRVQRRTIPFLKEGSPVRFSRKALLAWMEQEARSGQ